jgi:uncharacterized protein YbaA (DUF1428 family)
MTRYVDGFVLPLPKDRLADYEAIARKASAVWKEHGALEYSECVGDDLGTECSRSFTDMAGATGDEVVIFAWAVFASREARDAANAKIMADPRLADLMDPKQPLFDVMRMAHGGFREIVRA